MRATLAILAILVLFGVARGDAAGELGLTARLIEPDENAAKATAVVQVEVVGVELIDPALATPGATRSQGHLHYRVDKGPVIATPTPKLAFHDLSVGKHRIEVALADNAHQPLGPSQVLEVVIRPTVARK
jgi:hypothetical protein